MANISQRFIARTNRRQPTPRDIFCTTLRNQPMDSPFFRNYYYAPTSTYDAYPSPADSTMLNRRAAPRPARTQPSARVVSIPIHFVGSEQSERSRSEAAVRIQKVLRGFLVRRAVRKIRAVWREVEEMERRVEDGGMADGLRRDERERVRVNELLMGLLFRLDSVPGVDSAVRECRKKVIRRVVALQDRVDALAQVVNDSEARDSTDFDRNHDSVVEEKVDPNQTMEESVDHNSYPILEDATLEGDRMVHVDQTTEESVDQAVDTRCSSDHGSDSISEDATMEADPVVNADPNHTTKEFVDEEEILASGDEECVVNAIQEAAREEGSANGVVGERGDKRVDERDLKEVMEKMVEENNKLQRMISELCEREVFQSRMVNSLSQRVEALEKAVSKKRKAKKANACNARKGRYYL